MAARWRCESRTLGAPAEKEAVETIIEEVASDVLSNVTANVGARFSSARGGAVLSLAGQPVPLDAAAAAFAKTEAPRDASLRPGYEGGENWRSVSVDQLLRASAFELSLGAAEGESGGGPAQWTPWGRGDILLFDSDAAGARYDGNLKAGYLGIDAWLDDRWLAGVAASRSRVESDYALEDGGAGDLALTLTGARTPMCVSRPIDTPFRNRTQILDLDTHLRAFRRRLRAPVVCGGYVHVALSCRGGVFRAADARAPQGTPG